MKPVRFLSYPVFFDPGSRRAVGYVMEHFYGIRSRTRARRALKILARPAVPLFRRRGGDRLEDHPQWERLRPFLGGEKVEVVIDARRFFRVIDFRRREVRNIFKGVDSPVFFDNEVGARERLKGNDFIPRLLGVNREEMVFVEEYVCERPFKSGSLRRLHPVEFAGRVKEILRRVRGAGPLRPVTAADHASGLAGEILSRPEVAGGVRDYIRSLEERAAALGTIDLAFSHGDFRPDQVFFSPDGRIRVIDWENSGYSSPWRDPLDFYLNERWISAHPGVPPEFFLEAELPRLDGVCAIYLLELATVPIRIGRPSLLPRSLPVVREVGIRLNKEVLRSGRKGADESPGPRS